MTIAQDNVERFTTRTETDGLSAYLDALISQAIRTATAHYAAGQPGRGEFVLRRLGMRLTRLERAVEVPQ